MSFFDDEDEEPTTVRPAHTQQQTPPQPRRPQRTGGPGEVDHHAMMVRRRVAAGVGVVLLIAIVLLVNGCLKRGKQQALESYNTSVSKIAQESQAQVARPLFTTLAGATSKAALDVSSQVNQLRMQAEEQAKSARALSVPSAMASAQRNFLLTLDLRVEALTKVANLVRPALGGQAQQATASIAGAMEILLGSDVVYSQRVVPLIQEALAAAAISSRTTASSHFLPNLGWLQTATVQAKLTGQAATTTGAVAPGTHGHSLKSVSVGTNTLAPEPTLNHVSGGSNQTFTVMVENDSSNPETNVKVDVSVTSEGKTLTASHLINKTESGSTVNVDIPVNGIALGAASRVKVNIEAVPGETETENNKGSYIVIFAK